MPGGDSRGPIGKGAITGRAAGHRAGYHMPGYFSNAQGRNFGKGRGVRGDGFG